MSGVCIADKSFDKINFKETRLPKENTKTAASTIAIFQKQISNPSNSWIADLFPAT
jgi:hypothetical protein